MTLLEPVRTLKAQDKKSENKEQVLAGEDGTQTVVSMEQTKGETISWSCP